jgi:drug/metabolite transporter (DMT)-like permease
LLKGISFALAAYASYSCGDALIKHAGASTNVLVIGFFVTLFSTVPWLASRNSNESLEAILRPNRPFLVNARALSSVVASMSSIFAFTRLPIAEAYALIFLVPLCATIFSVFVLNEKVNWQRWLLLLIGFGGVLLVIKPGFREITLAHLAGLSVALFAGLTIVLTRLLAPVETASTLMGVLYGWMLAAFGILMLPGFTYPQPSIWLSLFAAGICSGMGHVLVLRALSLAPASRVGSIQYSQIIWAVVLGALFFAEFPDALSLLGLAIVGFTGFVSFFSGREPTAAVSSGATRN